jgi:hypothetical protein
MYILHRTTTNLYIYKTDLYSRQSLGVYNVKGVIQVGLKETVSHGLI